MAQLGGFEFRARRLVSYSAFWEDNFGLGREFLTYTTSLGLRGIHTPYGRLLTRRGVKC